MANGQALRARLRGLAGAISRQLPDVRGRYRLSRALDAVFGIPLAAGDAIVDVTAHDGSRWRLDLRTTFERLAFWSGRYDERTLALLASFLRPGDVVLDVGANIGFYTVRLARELQRLGGGTVHAFEPIPANARRLAYNVSANELDAIVRVHEVALGTHDGRIAFHTENEYSASTGNAAMIGAAVAPAFGADAEATVTTLDGFAARAGITSCALLKLDVEGAECDVLRGGAATIARARPVILAEYNAFWARQFGWDDTAYADFAREHGYTMRWLDERVDPVKRARVANLLLVPRGEEDRRRPADAPHV
jgi:FkbM family methyltransferase